ncbi:MAG: phosphatase PAP2 family protein [Acidimicrobiia bacterium]|nr:phosphatase PAP2 family protein [Acidimicrobiia bacterium]MYC57374.1 phosphatase PAP2 family protein [Acidimicrobiia bacterium]MYG94577.1 phosphatase PAP2 family protein [Acidimicrobiia bacterium]MYI31140.1 phosphatase PAP2 family protein [Acidimicrobiia bacterium]
MVRQLKIMLAPEIVSTTRNWRDFPGQVFIVTLAALIYFGVRMITKGAEDAAFNNAYDLITFQSWLKLDFEAWAQSAVLDYRWVVTFFNWVYVWLHWPMLLGTLLALYHFNRQRYTLMRNAMIVSGALGLMFFVLFPVAPPRFFAGFTDTVAELSSSYKFLQPPSIVNKYAAMPSFHVGWNVLAGVVIFRSTKSIAVRIFAVSSPLLMSIAVILTGNHWIVDGFVGIALVMIGLFVAHRLGWLTHRWKETTDASSNQHDKAAQESELEKVGPAGIEPTTERL